MKEIRMRQGYVVKVDDVDYDFLMRFKWRVLKDGHGTGPTYARTSVECLDGKQREILMHHLVLDRMYGYREDGLQTDHMDRNGLNNTRGNLRWVTKRVNSRNRGSNRGASSKYKGVYRDKYYGKWKSIIVDKVGKCHGIGYYEDELEAAMAYDLAAIKMYGSEGVYNFIDSDVPSLH